MLPAFSHATFAQDAAAGQPATQQPAAQEPPKTIYTGDMVIAAYAVNSDKIADYDQVIATLKDSLSKSMRPEAKQQLAGWKVMKNSAPQPDGSALYVHIISPVVRDADYSITNLVYEVVTDPMERLNFYNTYRAALKQPLFVIQGPIAADLSK
jgi:hypothetical protein